MSSRNPKPHQYNQGRINGFGRIGHNIVRTAIDDKDIQFVAVNDITDAKTLAHLLKYDSVLGNLPHNITHTDDTISIEGKAIKVFKTLKDPRKSTGPASARISWSSHWPLHQGAPKRKNTCVRR